MVQRMFGLSGSGMDIDSMVKQLMQAKRTQYSYLYQNRDLLVWKKQAYNDMYKAANTFATTLTSYKMSSALSIKNVSSSNTNVATATANADAANISKAKARAYAERLLPMAPGLAQTLNGLAARPMGGEVYLGFSTLLRRLPEVDKTAVARAQLPVLAHWAGRGDAAYRRNIAGFSTEMERLAKAFNP